MLSRAALNVISAIGVAISLTTAALQERTETEWCEQIAAEWQIPQSDVEFRFPDGSRVDILDRGNRIAWEADWAGDGHSNKWAEGIGQAIYYGLAV